MSIKGYKVFNPDWTCRGFKYEVGGTYQHDGDICMCKAGFHFCRKASDCFNYYNFDCRNHVAEVEAIGLVESEGNKSVTDKIYIVREIPWTELLTIVNEGLGCTGLCNTGNRNTGNCNTGDYNTGNHNTGGWNTGDWNTGNCNTGDYNTGYHNTGNRNTGGWNTGDWNTGFFCTTTPFVTAFNKATNISFSDFRCIEGVQVLNRNYKNNWWIYSQDMTDDEKKRIS